jgi:hypothetical protein
VADVDGSLEGELDKESEAFSIKEKASREMALRASPTTAAERVAA